jgi:hypothetical protein
MRDDEGNLSALLRPDFNLDLLLSMPSGMARHWLFRREAFLDAGGFDPACADAAEFDLLLRLIDAGGIEGLGHVHEPLLITPQQQIASKPSEQESILRHLRHRGYEEARVESTLPGCYRVHYGHRATPGVSIIIPTKNQFRLLLRCIDTLIEKTAYKNYEVLIVDNGSTEEDACTWLDGLEAMGNPQLRVIRYPQPFNYSAMNNLAAQHAAATIWCCSTTTRPSFAKTGSMRCSITPSAPRSVPSVRSCCIRMAGSSMRASSSDCAARPSILSSASRRMLPATCTACRWIRTTAPSRARA